MPSAIDAIPMTRGTGRYFDGKTSARHEAVVTLGAAVLQIEDADRRLLAEWPYDDIEEESAPENVLRLGRRHSATLERLEIRDPAFAAAIDERAIYVDRTGGLLRRQRMVAAGWTVTAMLSLLLAAWFGVPAVADRLAPLVPVLLERKLGDAIDMQVRSQLDGVRECGNDPAERTGQAALDRLVKRLEASAQLRVPLRVSVLTQHDANAFALPGGRIYVLQGLIEAADNADELAGVIAHELGHVAHRDGTKSVLQAGGLSLLFGMLLGDFIGGGAVVVAAKSVLQSSYSRKVETAADAYGAELMNKAGGDARALGTMLAKIGGATEPGATILLDHPETKTRIAAINRLADPRPGTQLLDAAEWAALRNICARGGA